MFDTLVFLEIFEIFVKVNIIDLNTTDIIGIIEINITRDLLTVWYKKEKKKEVFEMIRNILIIIIISALLILGVGCSVSNENEGIDGSLENQSQVTNIDQKEDISKDEKNREEGVEIEYIKISPDYKNSIYKEIYLAGGCFWGVQAYIDRILGVEYTNVGYANGDSKETDYNSINKTGHAETVYVVYDPEKITLDELLGYYFQIISPTSSIDKGSQYRSGIYYVDEEDKEIIDSVTEKAKEASVEEIIIEVQLLKNYVIAEDYHQKYFERKSGGNAYADLKSISKIKPWINIDDYPKPSMAEIREKLSDLQFDVTQRSSTEAPFVNEYWDNKEEGLYIDIVTGEPLFLSLDKYDSGTGWPSFTRPIQWNVMTYYKDESLGMDRIEVSSRSGDSHLGHLFYDGPVKEGGLRYCINSSSLDFIPTDNLEESGFSEFNIYFE